jgi:hypothetical protein
VLTVPVPEEPMLMYIAAMTQVVSTVPAPEEPMLGKTLKEKRWCIS